MTTAVQRRRGTNTEHATFTGLDGEITVNTTTYTLHVHDGATVGGVALAKADGSNLVTSSIDINGGTIDGTVIGGSSAAAGTFTSITGTSANINGTVTADGLTVDAAGDVAFGTKFFWDASAESLGIGTSNLTSHAFRVLNDTNASASFRTTDGTDKDFEIDVTSAASEVTVGPSTNHSLAFKTNGTERMRIDSSGNLLIGTTNTNPTGSNVVGAVIDSSGEGNFSVDGAEAIRLNRKTSDGMIARFLKDGSTVGSIGSSPTTSQTYFAGTSRGVTFGSSTLYPCSNTGSGQDAQLDIGSGTYRFKDLYLSGGVITGGGGTSNFGKISFVADSERATIIGGYASGGGGFLAFNTDTTGGSNLERARLDASGNLLVGVTSISDTTSRTYGNAFSGSGAVGNWTSWGSGSHTHATFRNGTGIVGTITTNGTTTAYNITSDERLKENIVDTTHTVDINDIKVRQYDWKSNGEHQRYGFIAQELEAVYPEAVHTPEDPELMKSVDYSKLVPLLVKEIQDLKAEVAALKGA